MKRKLQLKSLILTAALFVGQTLLAGSTTFNVVDDPTINAEDVDAPIFGDDNLIEFSD